MRRFAMLMVAGALSLAACSPAVGDLATAGEATAGLTAKAAPTATPAPTQTAGGPVVITAIASTAELAGTSGPGTGATPAPDNWTITPIPPLASGMGPTTLKYQLLAQYPDLFFCDPDYYPVARSDEMELAKQRFKQIQSNSEEYDAITKHLQIDGAATLSDQQKLDVYREHKRLAAVLFDVDGDAYKFQLQTQDANGKGLLISGRINGSGQVTAQQSLPTVTTCPICLAASTLIDTPAGPVAVTALRVGDLVWTLDAAGARVAAPLTAVGHVPAPAKHVMVHVVLADGRELWASPGHPTADGRRLGELRAGDRLDGARIVSAERVAYGQAATYDILPAGATGLYWANGVLLGSTLK